MMFMPACDPVQMPFENTFTFGLGRGPYTVHKKCYLKKDLLSYNIEYTKQFFDTYKNERKFFTLRIVDAHEFTGEPSSMTIDPNLADLLTYLDVSGHLNSTLIHLHSDHGDHLNPIAYTTVSGATEKYNPFYIQFLPPNFATPKWYPESTQRLTSCYDIYATNMAYLGQKGRFSDGVDLWGDAPVPEDRNCKDAGVYKPHKECKCLPQGVQKGQRRNGN